ncbi:MAG: hypothetical protein DIZ80_08185 [endosymbiont of Galathealinum brachiosum]|uniref:Uncharacterized protein n=1 Tax=endosymbiont of Galathealinum brachiosum TaxID=2200906 RepID=A0A370DGV0_9GAMM|nr:MAG: hypothetical protein DIZ80_08185 [endosymbiont of Galathealinum brachiosum]
MEKNKNIVMLGLFSISVFALSACSGEMSCEEIKVEYGEERDSISDNDGSIDDYDRIYKLYTKKFSDAKCPGAITN